MALDLVYPRPSVEGDALPFFAEPVAAGFPSPAAGYEGSSQKTESMVTPVFATPILTINWLA
ncbi:hypothetical protein ECTHUN648_50760 [Escherichia coli]|nr:hypothetical protein ECTHUN648_50760 [Escherichia coli]